MYSYDYNNLVLAFSTYLSDRLVWFCFGSEVKIGWIVFFFFLWGFAVVGLILLLLWILWIDIWFFMI
jgi:hypothetical protein